MGAAFFSEGVGLFQNWHYGRESILWAHRGHTLDQHSLRVAQEAYTLDQRALTIEAVNAIREDARDLFQARAARLDNLFVVVTLMLTVGFGFVVEGTFPPENALPEAETAVIAYACFCALALVCPFFSLICVMQCKTYLDQSFDYSIRKINMVLDMMLSKLFSETNSLPMNIIEEVSSISRVQRDGWDNRCEFYFKLGKFFFQLSLVVAMVLCCLLLGLFYKYTYTDSDTVWRCYVYVVGGGCGIGVCVMWGVNMHDFHRRRTQAHQTQRPPATISRRLSAPLNVGQTAAALPPIPGAAAGGGGGGAAAPAERPRLPVAASRQEQPAVTRARSVDELRRERSWRVPGFVAGGGQDSGGGAPGWFRAASGFVGRMSPISTRSDSGHVAAGDPLLLRDESPQEQAPPPLFSPKPRIVDGGSSAAAGVRTRTPPTDD